MKNCPTSKGFIQHHRGAGFTLIELLIVIAVLGVLAGAILIAINPLEKLAKAKDSSITTTVSTLTNALQAYSTLHDGKYPSASAVDKNWIDKLVLSQDLKNVPPLIPSTCTIQQNGYCYQVSADQSQAMVYASLSSSDRPSGTSGTNLFVLWYSPISQSGSYYSIGSDLPDISSLSSSGFTFGQGSTLTQGLVGWWKLNNNADDSTTNSNNGIVTGAQPAFDRNGYLKAYGFNGTSDSISIPHNSVLDVGSVATYAFWFKLSAQPTVDSAMQLLNKDAAGSSDRSFFLNYQDFTGTKKFDVRAVTGGGSNGARYQFNYTLTLNQWYHIVAVYNQNETNILRWKMWIDGISIARSGGAPDDNTAPSTNINPLKIGSNQAGGQYLNGSLDDIRIYNRVLQPGEIQNLWTAGPQ